MPTRFQQLALPVVIAISLVVTHAVIASAKTSSQRRTSRFKLVDHSCESGCTDTYESADGKQVSLVFACYTGDASGARSEIRRMLSEGRVISRSTRLGKSKRSERTVMRKPGEHGKSGAMIFWYQRGDSCFTYIDAESLSLALALERDQAREAPLKSYVRR